MQVDEVWKEIGPAIACTSLSEAWACRHFAALGKNNKPTDQEIITTQALAEETLGDPDKVNKEL